MAGNPAIRPYLSSAVASEDKEKPPLRGFFFSLFWVVLYAEKG
jgi:hypothetical protein